MGDILAFSLRSTNLLLQKIASTHSTDITNLLAQCLKLAISCLTFDFSGRGEDSDTSLVPLSWSTYVLDKNLIQPVFGIVLGSFAEHLKIAAARILGEFCYVRTTLFKGLRERQKYYGNISPCLFDLMNQSLSTHSLYNEALTAFHKFSVFHSLTVPKLDHVQKQRLRS